MANRYWVGGTGNWTTTTTNWSATSGGASGASVPTAADSVFFDGNSNIGTGAFTVTVTSAANCLDLNISNTVVGTALDAVMSLAGTFNINIAGSLYTPPSPSTNFNRGSYSGVMTFTSTTTGRTITGSGGGGGQAFTFSGLGGGWTLQDTLFGGAVVLTAGTLALGSNTLYASSFTSNNSNTRSINFGTGNINVSGFSWNTATVTGFSYTGTPTVNMSNSTATATTVTTGPMTAAQALDFNFTAGTYALTLSTGNVYKNLNFTGFAGTVAFAATTHTMYGNLTLGTATTTSATAGTGTFTWNSTSGTRTITSNGRTANFGITLNGVGQTLQLADAFIQGSTQSFFYTAGTFDLATYSTSLGAFTIQTGTHAITNGTVNAASVTHTSGDLSIGSGYLVNCTGTYTFTAGTITINNGVSLTVAAFSSSNTNARTVSFGTGNITTTGTGTVWNVAGVTGWTATGNSNVTISNNTATAVTVTNTAVVNFNFINGTYTLTLTTGNRYISLDFTGFAGTVAFAATTHTMLGNLNLGSTATTSATAGTATLSWISTVGTRTITSNGRTSNFGITLNGVGQTLQLADAFIQGSTQSFFYTAGTFDMANYSTSLGIFTITAGTHAITNGTVNAASVTHTSGDLAIGTGYNVSCTGTYTFTAGSITINNGVNLNVGTFSSANTGTRSIAFGTAGAIRTTGTGTVWNVTGVTGLSYTGNSNITIDNNTSTAITVTNTAIGSSAFSFAFINGTYVLTLTTGNSYYSLNFTGFSGTIAFGTTTHTMFGSLWLDSNTVTTATAGTATLLWPSTTGTQTITTNGATVNFGVSLNGVGGTLQFADNFTQGPTQLLILTNGTLDVNAKTTSAGILTVITGSSSIVSSATANGTLNCASVTHTSGNLTIGTGTTYTGTIASAGTYTFTAGTITINNGVALSARTFSSSNANVRSIAFGTGQISLTGNSAVMWDTTTATSFTSTGTRRVNLTSSGATGIRTISSGTTLIGTTAINFYVTAGTDTITFTGGVAVGDLDFTGFAGTWTNNAVSIYGSLTLSSTMAINSGANTITFASTATGKTITTSGELLDFPIIFNGTGGSWALQDAFTALRTVTLTAGTLDLNAKTLTGLSFTSTGTVTRSIGSTGGTGFITTTGPGTALNIGGSAITGTGVWGFKISYSGLSATTVTNPLLFQTTYINAGSYTLTLTTGNTYNDLDFTGFNGTWAAGTTVQNVYGSLVLPTTGGTYSGTAGTSHITFQGTSGTKNIVTNSRTVDFGININGAGKTIQLADNFTQTSTQSFTLTNGTLDINATTTSIGIFTVLSGTHAIANGTLNCASVTHTSGDLSTGTGYLVVSSGRYNFTAGTITINNGVALSAGAFFSNNANTRSIAFGTGKIILTNSVVGSGTIWDTGTVTGFSYTGTSAVEIFNSSVDSTVITTGAMSAAQSLNFSVTTGTYALTLTTASVFNNLSFVGFGGSVPLLSSAITVYGNIAYGAATTSSATTGTITLAGTTAKTITTNGAIIGHNITVSGVLGTYTLQDAFTGTGTGTVTLSNGTLALGSYSLTVGAFVSNTATARTLNMGTNTGITIIGNARTVWDMGTTTNFTLSPATPTPTISFTYAGATGTRTIHSGSTLTGANAFSFAVTAGTDTITFTASNTMYSLDFTGFSGTWTNTAITMYGNLTLSSTMIVGAGANALTFAFTTGSRTVTSNGETLDFPITINGTGGTVQFADSFTHGVTRAFTLTNGTLDINSQTNSIGIFTVLTGTHAIANGTVNCASVTHTSGDLSIGTGYLINCAGTYTFTAGTITINNGVTLTAGLFVSSNSNARSIAFGTGQINLTSNGGYIWDTKIATNFSSTGTSKINLTYAGSIGFRSIHPGTLTETTSLNFNVTAGSDIVNLGFGAGYTAKNIDFTGFSGTVDVVANFTIYGNLIIPSTATMGTTSATTLTFAATSITTGTQLLTTSGIGNIACGLALTGGAILQLQSNISQATTAAFTLTNGTLDINSQTNSIGILTVTTGTSVIANGTLNCISVTHTSGTLTVGSGTVASAGTYTFTAGTITINNGVTLSAAAFSSSNANVRSIAFGTGNITLTGTGTVWNTSTVTNFSYTGTSAVNITNPTSTGTNIGPGAMSTTQALNFNITTGTYDLFIDSGSVKNLNFTGFKGNSTIGLPASIVNLIVYGNLTYDADMTSSSGSGSAITLSGTGGTITTNNNANIGHNITINCGSGNYTLQGAFNGTNLMTLTSGTFLLGSNSLTVGAFNSSGSTLRTLNMGTNTFISIVGNARTVWDTGIPTNLTITTTPIVQLKYTGSTGTRTINSGSTLTGTSAINFHIHSGSDTVTFTTSNTVGELSFFSNFNGTWANTAITVYGDLSTGSSTIITGGANAVTFARTSGTSAIYCNTKTWDFPITINGIGGTVRFVGTFAQGSTRAFTLTNGTLDINSQTNSIGIFTITTGTHAIANGTVNAVSVTHTSGDLSIGTGYLINCAGTYTFTAGTITINNGVALNAATFVSANSNARSIAFGTGSITLTGTGTAWDTNIVANFSYTGTSAVNIANGTATATTVSTGIPTAAQALNFNFTAGTYSLTLVSGMVFNNLNFTGFAGTYVQAATTITVYGDLTFSSGMTSTTTTGSLTISGFASPTYIYGNGHSVGCNIIITKSSSNAQVWLGSAFTSTLVNGFSFTCGVFDTRNYNLTLNTFSSTGALARLLTLGSSQVTVTGSGATAWNTDASLSVSASTATISMTSSSAKTFVGSGKTWYKLNQGGLGDLSITGNNTFNDISNTVQPSIIYFPSGGTTTVSNFSLKGTYGKLTSITSTPSTHTLTKTSGIVSVNYCNVSKSIATGGASWRAYNTDGNTNSGTNTGWIFINPNSPTNFFSFFL